MTLLICNEIVRMDGTFVTSVQHLDADAKKGGEGGLSESHISVFISSRGVLMDQQMLNV